VELPLTTNVSLANLINEAVRVYKDFANIVAIQLRYDAAGLRSGANAVPAYPEVLRYAFCITPRVAGNEVADRLDLFRCRFAPQFGDNHHFAKNVNAPSIRSNPMLMEKAPGKFCRGLY